MDASCTLVNPAAQCGRAQIQAYTTFGFSNFWALCIWESDAHNRRNSMAND